MLYVNIEINYLYPR